MQTPYSRVSPPGKINSNSGHSPPPTTDTLHHLTV